MYRIGENNTLTLLKTINKPVPVYHLLFVHTPFLYMIYSNSNPVAKRSQIRSQKYQEPSQPFILKHLNTCIRSQICSNPGLPLDEWSSLLKTAEITVANEYLGSNPAFPTRCL